MQVKLGKQWVQGAWASQLGAGAAGMLPQGTMTPGRPLFKGRWEPGKPDWERGL